jgi:hypothetical protein
MADRGQFVQMAMHGGRLSMMVKLVGRLRARTQFAGLRQYHEGYAYE